MRQLNEHLRRALEDAEANSQPIAFKGPLGQAITDALNQEYSKKEPEEGKEEGKENAPAMESQQLMHEELSRVAALLAEGEVAQNQSALYVYGVSQTEMEEQDLINVTNDVAAMAPDDRDNYVIIVQENPETQEGEVVAKELSGAMESIAKAFKIKTYPSLEAFAKARFG